MGKEGWEMWFVHSVRRLLGGVQLLEDSKESMQEFDAQKLPQQEPFLAVLCPRKAESDFHKSQGSKLPLCEVKKLCSVLVCGFSSSLMTFSGF